MKHAGVRLALVLPLGLGLGAAATSGWVVHGISESYTSYFTLRSFLHYWFWACTPYLGLAALCVWSRARVNVSRLIGAALVLVSLVGFYGMHWYVSGTPAEQANYSWLLLYAPLVQWLIATPLLLIGLVVWSVHLRQYRQEKWQEYTTRGGTWESEEEAGE